MRRVLELSAFRRLLAGAVVNELAFSVGSVALALLVYRRTGSAIGAMGFFLCAEFVPAFASPFVVARVDHRSAREVLALLYTLEGLLFLILAALVSRFAVVPLLILTLVDGALSVTARVLARAAWTSLTAPNGFLREANAVANSSLATALMVGPAIGGAVVALGGTVAALLVNVGLFAVMAMLIATASGVPRPATDPDAVPNAGRLRAMLARARSEPLIRRLLAVQAAGMMFFAISIPVEVVFAKKSLHTGASGYGFLLAAWGAGGIAGSAIYARWRRLSSRLLMTLGATAFGVGFLVMALAPTLGAALVGSGLAGVGNGLELVAFRTALQEATPPRLMALMLSLIESMFQAVPGAGILLGGAIAAAAGPRIALGTAAVGAFMVALAVWRFLRELSTSFLADGVPEPERQPTSIA